MTIGKVRFTDEFARYRVRAPYVFTKGTLRTQAIGDKGTKRVAGWLKKNKEWGTQAILIPISLYDKGERVKILNNKKFTIYNIKTKK